MVHTELGERKRGKPRGRPFTSTNNPSKLKNKVLDAQGLDTSDEGGIIASVPQQAGIEALQEGLDAINLQADQRLKNICEKLTTECVQEEKGESVISPTPPPETIESIDFKNGSNSLKIVFKRRHNRMFRIQIFLNDQTEIRPITYTGSSTAFSFWNLLKGSLKKD